MIYQCPDLAAYVPLWLQFRDAELNAEIVSHRDTCPICTALREATIERRIARERADSLAREISKQSQLAPSAGGAGMLPDLSRFIVPREGEDRRVRESVGASGGRADWLFRVDSAVRSMVGEATESEVSL